jgi:2-oxo-4-hydroxy-4-carboxy-5-ureidoimidazoline decarboxylase
MSSAAAATTAAIADGNAAYEERFGRVFLIRAAGRTPEQMRAELERRLGNDDETEAAEALDQLREIALLRLETTIV